jgi:gliding motility-associated-like protein
MQRVSYQLYLLAFLLGILLPLAHAQQVPTYAWVWAGGSLNNAYVSGNRIAVDSAGNSYTAGVFLSTAVFGTQTLVAQNQHYGDTYLAKHSPQGTLLWVKQLSGPQFKAATDIAVDATGTIYLAGHFSGPLTIGTTTLMGNSATSNYYDTFLAKFTPQGTLLWAKQSSNANGGSATCTSLAIDKAGKVYLAGKMYGQVQFDQLNFTTSFSRPENFLACYTSQGLLQGVRTGFGNDEMSIAVSPDGTLYLAASFSAGFTLGTYTLPPPPPFQFGLYLAKLDAQFSCLWVRYGFTDGSYRINPTCGGLAVDPTSRGVVFSVTFGGPTTFDGHTFNCVGGCFPNSASMNTGSDALILKYDAQGRFVWSQQVGGPLPASGGGPNGFVTQATDVAGKPAIDAQGNSYVLLSLFGMPTLTSSVPTASQWYAHLVSYTRTGRLRWTRPLDTASLGSTNSNSGAPFSVVWSATGYLYSTGYTQGPARFDALPVSLTGLYNAYTAKLNLPASADLEPESAVQFIPNIITPNGDGQNDTFTMPDLPDGPWQLHIYSRWGRLVYQTTNYRQDWNAPGLPDGLYYYYLQSPTQPTASKGWVEVIH